MFADRTLAIAERIVRQVLRDRRTLALIVVAPLVVMSLTAPARARPVDPAPSA